MPTNLDSPPVQMAVTGNYADFVIRGASYGPDGEELAPVSCYPTYAWVTDSTSWSHQLGDTWVYGYKYHASTCVGEGSGNNRVGGNLSIYATGSGGSHGVGIVADQSEEGSLTYVPASDATVYLSASPWFWKSEVQESGTYRFWYWRITRADNSVYYDYNADLVRSGTTSDWEYIANFKVCILNTLHTACANDPTLQP